MTTQTIPSRRAFLKSGVCIAAPLVAVPAVAMAGEGTTRLARLESEAAIRTLHGNLVRRINAGDRDAAAALFVGRRATFEPGLLAITDVETETVEWSPGESGARGRYPCKVEIETIMPMDCTFARMAHAQGGGCVRRTEQQVMLVDYLRGDTGWTIARVDFASA
jgi:hypothetical protein